MGSYIFHIWVACVAGVERGRGIWARARRPNSPFPFPFPFQRRPRRLIYGLLYSQKKILWPWIFHSRSSRSLRGPTLKYIFPFQPFASSALAFSRLSDGGESAKVWKMRKRKAGEKGGGAGKRKFPPSFFLVCTSSILRTRLSRGTCGSRVCGNSCPRKGGIQ